MGQKLRVAPGNLFENSAIGGATAAGDIPFAYLNLPGLVNWWRAEDRSVTSGYATLIDRKGGVMATARDNDPAYNPSATTVDGVPALGFAGSQYLTFAPGAIIHGQAFSWVFVFTAPTPIGNEGLFGTHNASGDQEGPQILNMADGGIGLRLSVEPPADTFLYTAGGLVPNDDPVIVGVSINAAGTSAKISINGVLQFTGAFGTGFPPATDGYAVLGAIDGFGAPFSGKIMDVIQFDTDIHDAGYADNLRQLAALLKARAGIA